MGEVVHADNSKARGNFPFPELYRTKETTADSNSEDKLSSVSTLLSLPSIQENKASHLERSFELSEQKSKELDDLFTEVDRKPASELANLEDHLTDITLKTQSVNAYVNSSVALAESAIHVLPNKKQASVRKSIAEVKKSAANMNAGVDMYDRIVNIIKSMSDNSMKPTGDAAMKYTKFNTAVSNFIADMNKLTKNEGSNVVINRFKVEQQLRQLMKDYSADQEAGILYTVDTAKQSKDNEAIAKKKAEDLGLDPAKVVKQKGNKWLVTLDTSPLEKMLELLPAYQSASDKNEAERLLEMFSSDDYKENIRIAVQEGILDKSYNKPDFFDEMDLDMTMKFVSFLQKNNVSNIGHMITTEVKKFEALEKMVDAESITSINMKGIIPREDGRIITYESLASNGYGDWTKWMPGHHREWFEGGAGNRSRYISTDHVKGYLKYTKKEFFLEKIKKLMDDKVDVEAIKASFFNELISEKLENKFPTVSINGSQYNIFSSGFKIPETQVENTSSAVTRKAAGILTNIETLIQKLIQNLKSLYELINSAFASIGR